MAVLSSSRIRSKTSTLASTAMPIVSTMPAIPGRVRVAPIIDKRPKIKPTLIISAALAKRPKVPYDNAIKINTDTKATMHATFPASILSWPNSGPTVRSSKNSKLAGSDPARNNVASLVLSSTSKFPVIIPDPPVIAD